MWWMTRYGIALGAGSVAASIGGGSIQALEVLFRRLHPILVHFPIVLVLVAIVFEIGDGIVRRRSPDKRASVSGSALVCLAIGVGFAGLSVWSGWENAEHESHARSIAGLIDLHRWLGISLAIMSGLALGSGIVGFRRGHRRGGRSAVGLYRTFLLLSAGLVAVVGHLGGSIVRGEGYLLEPLREAIFGPAESSDERAALTGQGGVEAGQRTVLEETSRESRKAVFEREVLPIFRARCIQCHGANKASGPRRMRLHEWGEVERIIDGPAGLIVSGFPEFSELYRRVTLASDDLDLMPAEGEALTDAEVEAVQHWIESLATPGGAPDEGSGSQQPDKSTMPEGASLEMSGEAELAIHRIRDAGGYGDRVSLASNAVVANLSMLNQRGGDQIVSLLDGLERSLVELDLGATAVGDLEVAKLGRFENLRRLDLSRTRVTNIGVAALVGLGRLESLNLYGTAVDDGAVENLAAMVGLKKLYLWDSAMTDVGVEMLRSRLEDCVVDAGSVGDADGPS